MLRPIVTMAAVAAGLWIGMPAAVAQGLVPCAQENGYCSVPYPTRVIYGVPGRGTALDVRDRGIPCSNDVFGDPAPGTPKRCAYVARGHGGGYGRPAYERPRYEHSEYNEPRYERPRHYDRRSDYVRLGREERSAWRTCALENGFCNFEGRMRVRYGADGRFAEGAFRNGVACSNSVFGDSAPGIRKVCQVRD